MSEDYELIAEAGDCACMESEMALAWSAAGKHRCRILAVTPAGPPSPRPSAPHRKKAQNERPDER